MGNKWLCKSCGGVYDEQPGGYTHMCPPGTEQPRNENWEPYGKDKRRMKRVGKGRKKVVAEVL